LQQGISFGCPLNFILFEIREQLLNLSRWGQKKIGKAATTRRGTPKKIDN